MKNIIKFLSVLCLFGGLLSLTGSQNVRPFATKNIETKQIYNKAAFEQFKELVTENEKLSKKNIVPERSEIKNDQGDDINAFLKFFFNVPENKIDLIISSAKQEGCKSILSEYDELSVKIYDESNDLFKTIKLNKLDENEYIKKFVYSFDLNNCELEKGKQYLFKIFNSNDELLGKSDFYFQNWMTPFVTGENNKMLNDEFRILFFSSIYGEQDGVARLEIFNSNKNDENSIFKSGSEQFTIDLYDTNGNYVLTKKAKATQIESETSKYLEIYIDKNEMPSIESRGAMFIEIFNGNNEYLGSIPHINLFMANTIRNKNKFISNTKSCFLNSKNQPLSCSVINLCENILEQDDVESRLYEYMPAATSLHNLINIPPTVDKTFYIYLVSKINDKNNKFVNCLDKLFFKFEYDGIEPVILESESVIKSERCKLVADKIKITKEYIKFLNKIDKQQLNNIRIHVYSDKEMTKEIETMRFNT